MYVCMYVCVCLLGKPFRHTIRPLSNCIDFPDTRRLQIRGMNEIMEKQLNAVQEAIAREKVHLVLREEVGK